MAAHKRSVVTELKKIRRKLSARLARAKAEGRELEELRAMERKADRSYRTATNSTKNGHSARSR